MTAAVLDPLEAPSPNVHSYTPRGSALQAFHCRDDELLMSGPAGTGKAQPLDATVWTPTGPVRMGDIEPGDTVIGADGQPVKVLDIPFRGLAPVYRVTFSDGAQVECSDGHLWDVSWRDSGERLHRAVLPAVELVRLGLTKRNGTRLRYWVPQAAPVAFDERAVPVPAYTLGVLLGDGYLGRAEVSFTTADPEMAERVAAELPRYKLMTAAKPGSAASSYRIVADGWTPAPACAAKPGYVSRTSSGKWMARLRTATSSGTYIGSYDTEQAAHDAIAERALDGASLMSGDGIRADLNRLGLRHSISATKFVPEVYKHNSAAVRWALLQGLMDADGYAERTTVSFTSISEQLASDVRWLIESLGGTARITTKQPAGGQLAYTVFIRLPDPAEAFHLPRKRARVAGRQVPVRRWIESIEPVGERECQCITVDSMDGLYLADRFVVTHNSRALLEKLHAVMLANPGARGLIVRKVRDSLSSTGLVTWREHVIPEALALGVVSYYGGSSSEPPQYRYGNGSKVMIGGMDKPTKIMSSEYDMIFVQEAIELTETDWESLTTRLRNGRVSFQQLMADTNPDADTHWLHQRAVSGRTTMLACRHEDNPTLFDDTGQPTEEGRVYIGRLDNLTGVRKERLRHGRWVSAEGMIYEDWNPEIHLRQIADPPASWDRYWAVDFGFTNPFVLQCWAVDDDGRLHLYRELYRTRRLVEDHARDILAAVTKTDGTWREPRPRAIICDHDAEDRATLERHLGMSTVAAHKTVSDGIQAVQARLKVQPDGKPRLFISPTALVERDPELVKRKLPCSTAEEIPGYVWDRPTTGIGAERPPKEQPRKANDHGCDTKRYVVAHLDLRPGPGRVRWL